MGKPVYLGKLKLYWCDSLNLPSLSRECANGEIARKVPITPPGEVRPAFGGDIEILNRVVRRQFGTELSGYFILLNRVPHYDRMDEVIIDGKVIGNLKYDIEKGDFRLTLRMPGAFLLSKTMGKGWVVADDGAVKPILSGKNLMAPGVVDCRGVDEGDEVIILDSSGKAIGVGMARMPCGEMIEASRGVAVKLRHSGAGEWESRRQLSLDEVVRFNEDYLRNIERRALEFISNVADKYQLPLAVSFSGGKDSMAVLLLAIESGRPFKTFFLNTGIELPETVEFVDLVEKRYGIEIDRIEAGDAFFESLEHFGPPGRDYRWCCKVTKLGPTTRYILENYPKGLLTLIGQRRYESMERMRKGSVWRNEWVPNQLSASPIQNWTSLEVWLYLLWKDAPINPWYTRGLTRIGCYLCPSSDIADFKIVSEHFPGIEKWFSYLKEYARERNLPEEWVKSSWRWENPPSWAGGIRAPREKLKVDFHGEGWLTLEFNKEVDMDSLKNLLHALPEGSWREKNGKIEVDETYRNEAESLIIRSQECVACGICLARCPVNALKLENGKIKIVEESCIHCLDCLGKCPAEEF